MIDYTIFYKSRYSLDDRIWDDTNWDLFVSSFDKSDRVSLLYERINASQKKWLNNPLYHLSVADTPSDAFSLKTDDEAVFINTFFGSLNLNLNEIKICIDITGFLKPEMLYLFYYLTKSGVKYVDVLYSEPERYRLGHDTMFTDKNPMKTRFVKGYGGSDNQTAEADTLIIGIGYDDDLIARIAKHKAAAYKISIIGLPSLQPDMYQQSRIRSSIVKEEVDNFENLFFAPANDPFVTASVIQQIVHRTLMKKTITNLYLSPLGTHPQALGFALYYLYEGHENSTSIIYPFTAESVPGASEGIAKVWKYRVELPVHNNS